MVPKIFFYFVLYKEIFAIISFLVKIYNIIYDFMKIIEIFDSEHLS